MTKKEPVRKLPPPKAAKPKRADIDWESIEIQYRAGVRSLKSIGAEFGVSDAAIIKRAKRDSWDRDLAAKIRAKAEAKVSAAVVSAEVSADKAANFAATVEANAKLQADIILAQRSQVSDARELVISLLKELKAQTMAAADLDALADWVTAADGDDSKLADKVRKAIMDSLELPTRAHVMGKLAESLAKLVALERVVFGIEKDSAGESIEDILRKLADA